MATLRTTVEETHQWALDRVHLLSKSTDAESYFDAHSVVQEFEEWLDPDSSESHEIFSLAYIGDESEYQ